MMFRSILAMTVVAVSVSHARANLLVYEGYSGYTAGNLTGQAVNANAVGLTGNYTAVAGANTTWVSTGLTFGSGASTYAVQGGAATWAANGAGGVAAAISLSPSPYVGTLYGSYLINLGSAPQGDSVRAEVRVNATAGGATGSAFFDAAVVDVNGPTFSSIRYSTATPTTSNVLAANTTYMVISRFMNVGSTTPGVYGLSTMWVLSSAQYDALVAAGHLTDSFLNTAVVGTDVTEMVSASGDLASTANFSNGQYLQTLLASGSGLTTRTLDELKFGTSLLDVAAVPEPTITALLLGSVMVLVAAMRRRSVSIKAC